MNGPLDARRRMAMMTADQTAPYRALLANEETHRFILMLRPRPWWTARELGNAFGLAETVAYARLHQLECLGLVRRQLNLVDLDWGLTDAGEGLQSALIAIAESVAEGISHA